MTKRAGLPVRCLTVLAVLALESWPMLAQVPPAGIPQQEPPAAAPAEQTPADAAPAPVEQVAPDSPLASLRDFIAAADAGRWDEAARFLSATGEQRGPELAERLKGVLDTRRLIDLEAVSPESAGQRNDGLPADLEQIAVIESDGVEEPVRLIRTSDGQGAFWAFSPSTVARVDDWYAALPDRWLRDAFAGTRFDFLLLPGSFGVLWWQWFVLPLVAVLSWAVGRGTRVLVRFPIRRLAPRTATTWVDRILEATGPPLTLAFSIFLFAIACVLLQLTSRALEFVATFTRPAMAFAVFWALWRFVPLVITWTMSRDWAASSASLRNLLSIGSNILRGAIIGMGALAIITAFGYPIGTVLAGLGIGGLALAFGAQKTVENLFGSVSLAVDQPFRIGDFVKVDDFVGTVEDIGLRSTRFRTLDRTIVSIPNGKLADQRLESLQARDRMRLATTIGLTYGTTRRQMQAVLEGFARVLRAHARIWPDAMVVKFKEFGASSLDVEIMAWFEVPTWAEFQACREDVLLEFMRVVEEAGTSFAFPTRTVHLVQDEAPRAIPINVSREAM